MKGGIFLVQNDDRLIEMTEHSYDSEDILQSLLEKHPNLLAGDQINEIEPRRWILVSRELSIPIEEDASGRFSVDHLLLDQDGIPTFVEVKRSSDTRIRREVIGQMLDYVANAVAYLTVDSIRAEFIQTCTERELNPDIELQNFLDPNTSTDDFWQTVKTNLRAGKIRMLFVADEIPAELRRVVEFLNEQMDSAEVLAVEIKQYVGEGLKTLVPRVIGKTAVAERTKRTARAKKQWDEDSFFQELEGKCSDEDVRVARKILDWVKENTDDIWWGKGGVQGSFIPMVSQANNNYTFIAVWTYGNIEFQFQHMRKWQPFSQAEKQKELLDQLNRIPGISFSSDSITRRPSLSLTVFQDRANLERFFSVFKWVVKEYRNVSGDN